MSQLVVGLSHHTAPLAVLERAMLAPDETDKLARSLVAGLDVSECAVLTTCNRVEVIAEVERFHAGVDRITQLLAESTGLARDELATHLYVHFAESAVQHVFTVTTGLDSMVPGETQILGQVRRTLRRAQDEGTVGPSLQDLLQQALRVGKRVHAETDLGRIGRSVVSVGLANATQELAGLSHRVAVVLGAGTMGSLVARTLRGMGAGEIIVANRTYERGLSVAESVNGQAITMMDLPTQLERSDLLVTCIGSVGYVLGVDDLSRALEVRPDRGLFVLDLAVPRDVDPAVSGLSGVRLLSLADIAPDAGEGEVAGQIDAARAIVAAEVLLFAGQRRAAQVAPTVVALRSMAADAVAAEMSRLQTRLPPDTDPAVLAEVGSTVRRLVDKLIHAPTVRVKELAATGSPGPDYGEALRELFALDPRAVDALASYDEQAP